MTPYQVNVEKSEKMVKIVSIEEANLHNVWTNLGITIKFSGMMWLMIKLNVTKNHRFHHRFSKNTGSLSPTVNISLLLNARQKEAVTLKCSANALFLKLKACSLLLKTDSNTAVFLWIFKITYFVEHLQVALCGQETLDLFRTISFYTWQAFFQNKAKFPFRFFLPLLSDLQGQ